MAKEKTRYSEEEMEEFEEIIMDKLVSARKEFSFIKDSLSRRAENDTQSHPSKLNIMEGGMETMEREKLSQLAMRQQKFIQKLENALVRIKNKTYGICMVTGQLIEKERLRAVPHTTQSIEAKTKHPRA